MCCCSNSKKEENKILHMSALRIILPLVFFYMLCVSAGVLIWNEIVKGSRDRTASVSSGYTTFSSIGNFIVRSYIIRFLVCTKKGSILWENNKAKISSEFTKKFYFLRFIWVFIYLFFFFFFKQIMVITGASFLIFRKFLSIHCF